MSGKYAGDVRIGSHTIFGRKFTRQRLNRDNKCTVSAYYYKYDPQIRYTDPTTQEANKARSSVVYRIKVTLKAKFANKNHPNLPFKSDGIR